jgi:Chitin binding Peritrophin-A domain
MFNKILLVLVPLAAAQVPPPDCTDVPDFSYIASLVACYRYYQCIEGAAYQLQCPRGMYFSTAQQTCVAPDDSDCPLITPPPPTCNDVPEFGYIPSLEACEFYYQCIEGATFRLQCPRGLYFSFTNQTCVNPVDSDCPLLTPSPSCESLPEFSLIHSPAGCDFYYICIEDRRFLVKCPRGLHFDFDQQSCVPSDEVNCLL